jgi:hypothetical protein
MLIRSVTAHAFGPLVGETLEFADMMTVVHGPNESAKSTWHAAVYAALCGRRRGPGGLSPDEREFAARHRPWDRPDWLVSGRLLLDDGRQVEIRQDLDGKVDCDAVDLELGRDCSAEIMHDGAPDAARWLGLDRASFRATACVGQGQVLDVLSRADGLQTHLQRAASTAAADHTAAAALRLIDRFQADHVGSDRAPKRPLRLTLQAVQLAATALERARADHAEYERRLLDVDRLRTTAIDAEHAVRLREAADAADAARRARRLADDAADVAASLSGATPPRAPSAETLALVAAALSGSDPDAPDDGRAGPDDDVGIVAEEELYDLARAIDATPPEPDPTIGAQVEDARSRLGRATRARVRASALVAAGLLVIAIGLFVLASGPRLVGAVAAITGGLVASVAVVAFGRAGGRIALARRGLAAAEHRMAAVRAEAAAARIRREGALATAAVAGLSTDSSALRELAHRQAQRRAFQLRDEQWRRERELARADRLRSAARAAGVTAETPAEAESALRAWQRDQLVAGESRARYVRDTAKLEALLRGESLAVIEQRAVAAEQRADRLVVNIAESTVDSTDHEGLESLRAAAVAAAQAAHGADALLNEWLAGVMQVADAEEELSRAEAELTRLRRLDETLALTRTFLQRAEETAHRTIAPRLAEAVRAWLPRTTAGRYTEVVVDPEQLRVRVRGPAGRWRDAGRLSYGSAEQIYLMLRFALAEHLATPGVRCPLLLDEVTVHADPLRTAQLLELLQAASGDRQIILFTQQEQVLAWARKHLAVAGHALVELREVAAV